MLFSALLVITLLWPVVEARATKALPINRADANGVARWQAEDTPSDLPADDPLDGDAADASGNDDTATEPASDPLDSEPATDTPAPTPTPMTTAPAATETATIADAAPVATSVLPDVFGRGETIVLNPPGGTTVTPPTDCKYLLQHGRAVIGLGCGDKAPPWWLSQVNATGVGPTPARAAAPAPATTVGGSTALISAAGGTLGARDDLVPIRIANIDGRETVIFPDKTSLVNPDRSLSERGDNAPGQKLRRRLGVFQNRGRANADQRSTVTNPAVRQQTIAGKRERSAADSPHNQSIRQSVGASKSAGAAPKRGTAHSSPVSTCKRWRDVRATKQRTTALGDQLRLRCHAQRAPR